MEAWSYPLHSRYVGAWAPDLRVLRPDAHWLLYWTLLHDPQLAFDTDAWRTSSDIHDRAFRRSRAALIEGGLLSDAGALIAIPASSHLSRDMPSAQRRLQLAWALYGPQSRKERARVTGVGYNSKALSWDAYGPAPDRSMALDWIGRTCTRGRQWARNRVQEAGTATILAWQPVWHLFQRRLRKGTPWLVHALRNRNLPHLRDVDHLADWTFEAVQLPLFQDALPDRKVTPGGQKSDSWADRKVTPGGQKSDGFAPLVNRYVNRDRVKDCKESGTGESAAEPRTGHFTGSYVASLSGIALTDYLRALGLSEQQIDEYRHRENV